MVCSCNSAFIFNFKNILNLLCSYDHIAWYVEVIVYLYLISDMLNSLMMKTELSKALHRIEKYFSNVGMFVITFLFLRRFYQGFFLSFSLYGISDGDWIFFIHSLVYHWFIAKTWNIIQIFAVYLTAEFKELQRFSI